MKKILIVLCLGLVFVSCGEKRVLVDELVFDGWDDQTIYYDSKPFNGIAFSLHSNGKVFREMSVKQGKTNGFLKDWYENGQLKKERYYKPGGILDGLSKHWHENGQLASECNFNEGKVDGLSKYWYENGQLNEDGSYDQEVMGWAIEKVIGFDEKNVPLF